MAPCSTNRPGFVLAALALGVALLCSCKNRLVAEVDGVLLADCDGSIEVAETALTKVVAIRHSLGGDSPKLSIAEQIDADRKAIAALASDGALAIAREIKWPRVEAMLETLAKTGKQPALLCGKTSDVRAFVLDDKLSAGKAIQLVVEPKGKFCVQTPELPQAFCVQGSLGHIPRADVRQTIRETVGKWERTDVQVSIDPEVEWADVVRAIDGARTCCKGTEIRVARKAKGAPAYENLEPPTE